MGELGPQTLTVGGREILIGSNPIRVGCLEILTSVESLAGGLVVSTVVRNLCRAPVSLPEIGITVPVEPSRILEHGWQSWSVVRRCHPSDVLPARSWLPAWLRAMLLADPNGAGERVAGDQFLLSDVGLVGFVGGHSHLGVVRSEPGRQVAVALLDGAELAPGGERVLEPVWIAGGDPSQLYSQWLDLWAAHDGARCATPAPLGWCSWYQYQSAVRPDDVAANLPLLAEHGIQVVQIDDGYQSRVGDWLDFRPGWEGGLSGLATAIAGTGMAPGIWTAPFLAAADSQLARHHPDWLVKGEDGRALGVAWNPTWGGWAHALDTTCPRVLEHVRELFLELGAQGFRYFKVDFCYAAAVAGKRSQTVTRAEAMRRGLAAIREAIGDDAFLLASGCPLGPAVGLVDAMRVSPDTGPRWGPQAGDRLQFPEPQAALRFAVEASVLRAPMHRRLWINDPDCLMVRPFDTELNRVQRGIAAALTAGTGALMTLSDDTTRYTPEEWALVGELSADRKAADGLLELVDPFASVLEVRSKSTSLQVDWVGSAPPRVQPQESTVLAAVDQSVGPWAVLDKARVGTVPSPAGPA